MKIAVGKIVDYKISVEESFIINDLKDTVRDLSEEPIYRGNKATAGQTFPLLVTRLSSDGSINGQLFLDGNYSYWVNNAVEGIGPHTWNWPKEE